MSWVVDSPLAQPFADLIARKPDYWVLTIGGFDGGSMGETLCDSLAPIGGEGVFGVFNSAGTKLAPASYSFTKKDALGQYDETICSFDVSPQATVEEKLAQ